MNSRSNKVAIIGYGCDLPGGISDLLSIRNVVFDQKNLISHVPANRINLFDQKLRSYIKNSQGAFLQDLYHFDYENFGVLKKDAETLAPTVKKNILVSYQAIKNAGYSLETLPEQTAVVTATSPYQDFLLGYSDESLYQNPDFAMNNSPSTANGMLSFLFRIKGPSLCVNSACSTGVSVMSVGVDLALGSGAPVLVSTSSLNLSYYKSLLYAKNNMLSPTNRCHSFLQSADGYVRSEGAVAFLIKRLDLAERDGDFVYGVIESISINHNGKTPGIKQPSVDGQSVCFNDAVSRINFPKEKIELIEAHGTGTPVGDPIEIESTRRCYQHEAVLSATKSYFGHSEETAAFSSLLMVLSAFHYDFLPSIYAADREGLNSKINFGQLKVLKRPQIWGSKVKYAAINAFGFTGTNGHMILSHRKD